MRETIIVIPAHDCMDAGGRATQDAKAEAEIQSGTVCDCLWLDPRLRGDDDGVIASVFRLQ